METNWDAVKECVEQSMEQWTVPGVAVGILHHGEAVSDGFGVTSIENPLPVTDDTIFSMESISKTFTGTVIMQLVEQGKIRLDARVREYIPDFRVADEDASENVTVRHLLTHMQGWDGDPSPKAAGRPPGNGDDAYARYTASLVDREQLAPLGTVWCYNNSGYIVAGHIVEIVTGKLFEQAMQELVFDPLGMERSFMLPLDVMTYRFAVGHAVGPEGTQVVRTWQGGRYGGSVGGVLSTANDMLRYARFHLGDGETVDGKRLLSAESMAQLHSPQVRIHENEGQAIAFQINDWYGARQVSHTGNGHGTSSALIVVPEHDFAIVVLTNADRGEQTIREVTWFALQRYLGIEMKFPDLIDTTEMDLEEYVGEYSKPDTLIRVTMPAGKLTLEYLPRPTKGSSPSAPFPPLPLGMVARDMAKFTGGPLENVALIDFVRKPDGAVGWLRMGRIFKKM